MGNFLEQLRNRSQSDPDPWEASAEQIQHQHTIRQILPGLKRVLDGSVQLDGTGGFQAEESKTLTELGGADRDWPRSLEGCPLALFPNDEWVPGRREAFASHFHGPAESLSSARLVWTASAG